MSGVMKPFETLLGVDDTTLVEPRADVAVVRSDIRTRIQPAAGLDDIGANLFLDSGHDAENLPRHSSEQK